MNQADTDKIKSNFQANLNRVRNLVEAYDVLGTSGVGRPSAQQTDVLRSAVVLLHASLEDLIRSSSERLLPHAAKQVLDMIGFPDGPGPNKTKFSLGELNQYRSLSVDEVIQKAVQASLMRSNYNSVSELSAALQRIGMDANLLSPHQVTIESMMKRRHLIVHRADKNPMAGQGRGTPRTQHLRKTTVNHWVKVIEAVGTRIASALPNAGSMNP